MNQQMKQSSRRIELDLQGKLRAAASRDRFFAYIKHKTLRYRLHKPDWVSYVDRSVSWKNAQYALGLLAMDSSESIRALTKYYDRLLLAKRLGYPIFEVPDQVLHAEVMLALYRHYGKKRYKPLIREAASLLESIAEQNEGLVIYWPPEKTILVDSLGMISNFCYEYDRVFHAPRLTEIAKKQIDYTEQHCIDAGSGFPVHSMNYANGEAEGSSTWGRGIGWYLLGLTAYVKRFGEKTERLSQVFNLVFAHQDEDGLLYDDILHPTHVDTSTTCMAALCLADCMENDLLDGEALRKLRRPFARAVSALLASVNERGEVLNCSGECKAAGEYSADFGNYFAQGYTLMLFNRIDQSGKLRKVMNEAQPGE